MKNIIITGTSRGIGAELVKQFANEGHNVIAISRKENSEFKNFKNVHFISVDLSNEQAVLDFAHNIESNFKKIDILIHNAGSIINKPFSQISAAEFEYVYKVNVFGVAILTRAVLPLMQKGSHVVTISSMGGIQGSAKFPGLAAYSSSKGAVITLSELLAEEYKEQGIAFNVLALGAVQTEMLEEAFPGYQAPVKPIEMALYIKDFALTGNTFFNGKVLQVSQSTP
ncbi:SDR family NAD(P)-dependent oxidoreductase [Myroides sp. JBRI-B21084]|uniref:SDR family NAD(P)-dependent oxidoreductase n=1 Tax=Myroides sp. JBRI-B21084 TaxID=3119977 RepID=UPI0026E45E70|nr:SDR family oxidoreductase [Paenimyroides cloacae]WKW46345.1 SDR family NAD(P)-dependent oxidoreductase [Paenimyroides cloacae]